MSPSVEVTVPVVPVLRLVCGPSPRLLVRVVDDAGRPVPFAGLRLGRSEESRARLVPQTDHAGRVDLEHHLVPGSIRIELDDDYRHAADVLERVARQRRVKATRCEPVTVELRPDETSEVVLRIVDDP